MTHENNNPQWRSININAGTLVAIAALFATSLALGVGVPAWVDARVDDRISSRLMLIQNQMDRVERSLKEIKDEVKK